MTKPRKKRQHGGRRPGAGRKAPPDGARIPVCVKLPRDVVRYLALGGSTATIERCVRESLGFREWIESKGADE